MNKQRIYASLLILGASILLFRTIRLLTVENGWEVLTNWVIALTFIEMAIDISCIVFALPWLIKNSKSSRSISLRLGATAAIFHAFRVLIYVLGKTGPWINFDVKPQYRSSHEVDTVWVYVAAILAVMGIIGVMVIWILIKRSNKENTG
jgi:uncharacterized membrane protein YidH (DUF202 family)